MPLLPRSFSTTLRILLRIPTNPHRSPVHTLRDSLSPSHQVPRSWGEALPESPEFRPSSESTSEPRHLCRSIPRTSAKKTTRGKNTLAGTKVAQQMLPGAEQDQQAGGRSLSRQPSQTLEARGQMSPYVSFSASLLERRLLPFGWMAAGRASIQR